MLYNSLTIELDNAWIADPMTIHEYSALKNPSYITNQPIVIIKFPKTSNYLSPILSEINPPRRGIIILG